MNFEQRILKFIGKNKLITARGRLLIGVSGGADSMALLVALSLIRHELAVDLHAVHFNHQFRSQSGKDEQFVVKWCKKLNIPLTIGRRKGLKITHLSEDEARQMRFTFFSKTANSLNAQSVALAHTRNDVAETVLMRIMRGCGLYGLRAILPSRSIEGITYIRPLLEQGRQEVEAFLKLRKIPYCQDHTNFQTKYERNKIRLKLLPLLSKEYNPKVVHALSDLAATATEDYDFISMEAGKEFKKHVKVSSQSSTINLKGIHRLHPAILRLILRQMIEHLLDNPSPLTFEQIHEIEKLLLSNTQGVLKLPHHLMAQKTQNYLVIKYA